MLFFAEVYQIQHLRCEDTQILSYKHQVHQKSFNILTIYNYTHHSALFRVQNKGTLRNYVQSSEPPNMVCNLPTLVCRYLILYFQHPTTVKNHLHFHTFSSKSLHKPNKCLTFAVLEPPSLLTMLKSGVVLFLYHYEIIV